MGVDLSLKAIPKIGKKLIDKSESRKGTEYSSLLFHTFSAYKADFCDFGNSDWKEFKNDARELIPYYNDEKFFQKFQLDTNRTYEVIDYLINHAQAINKNKPVEFRKQESFYYSGIECEFCKGVQGRYLKYWDLEMLKKKRELIDSLSFEEIFKEYDEVDMIKQGVYKIEQIKHSPKVKIETVFNETKIFLNHAEKLGGYVLVCKD